MAQANAIIVRIRADAAEEFVRLFEAKGLPIQVAFVSDAWATISGTLSGTLLNQLWIR